MLSSNCTLQLQKEIWDGLLIYLKEIKTNLSLRQIIFSNIPSLLDIVLLILRGIRVVVSSWEKITKGYFCTRDTDMCLLRALNSLQRQKIQREYCSACDNYICDTQAMLLTYAPCMYIPSFFTIITLKTLLLKPYLEVSTNQSYIIFFPVFFFSPFFFLVCHLEITDTWTKIVIIHADPNVQHLFLQQAVLTTSVKTLPSTWHFPSLATSGQAMAYRADQKLHGNLDQLSECGGILEAVQCYCNCFHEYLFEPCAKALSLECTNKASTAPISPETSIHLVSVHTNSLMRKSNKKPKKQNKINQPKKANEETPNHKGKSWQVTISHICTVYQEVLIKKRKANSSVTNVLNNHYIEINLPKIFRKRTKQLKSY